MSVREVSVHELPSSFEVALSKVEYRHEHASRLKVGDVVVAHVDACNPFDAHAVRVDHGGAPVGMLPAKVARRLTGPGPWPGVVSDVAVGARDRLQVTVRLNLADEPCFKTPNLKSSNLESVGTEPEPGVPPVGSESDAPVVLVRSRSGRVLGALVSHDGDLVAVATVAGLLSVPSVLVRIDTQVIDG